MVTLSLCRFFAADFRHCFTPDAMLMLAYIRLLMLPPLRCLLIAAYFFAAIFYCYAVTLLPCC